ncbi:MAG: hypothetical protein K2J77_09075 [Oscillospiraceae bacterium]|nr:hypothetical protein [Oscillospiraceae bacterium]
MKTKQLLASILTLTLTLLFTPRASANSAQKFFRGTDAYGAIVTEENCPITVESELLTFDIPEFPNSGSNPGYKASVTAEYTFFNPADYTVTARLEFPFGSAPDYGTHRNDLTKYDITVNGAAINKTVRHTLMGVSYSFELETDMAKITDGFKEDDFFTPELPVTKYVYEITDYDENYHNACVAFDFSMSRNRKVFFDGMNDCNSLYDGYRLGRLARYSNKTLTVYVFGEQLDEPPKWIFYADEQCSKMADGSTAFVSADKMTFRELVMSIYPENESPLEEDWYNAVVDALNLHSRKDTQLDCVIDGTRVFDTKRANLMRWYEYEITIPPGERVVNTVTAPIYPTIDEGVNPALFRYTYLLSPAQNWADFGSLEVVVNTPYFLRKTGFSENDDNFEKTETGYKAAFDGLPDGELVFSLRTKKSAIGDITGNVPPWLAFFILIGYVAGIVGICLVVAALVRRKKK